MTGFSGKHIVVVGAGGGQGRMAVEMLTDSVDQPQALVAVDRRFEADTRQVFISQGAQIETLDILAERHALETMLARADLVLNLAGPFHVLGTSVLDAAISAACHYVDICDDADITLELLARNQDARQAGICALIGAGSAPGITNVLGRVALNNLPAGSERAMLEIAFVTAIQDVSLSIFSHIHHSLRSANGVPRWAELEPKHVQFPDPILGIETILFGHPEPITFRASLGVDVILRGGSIPSEMMHIAWALSSMIEQSRQVETSDAALLRAFEAYSAAGSAAALPEAVRGWGGLHIEASRGDDRVRIQTVSNETMAETTISPCISFARMVLNGQVPGSGVHSPEILTPGEFFNAARASPSVSNATTRLFAHRLDSTGSETPASMRELLSAPQCSG